MRTPRWPLLVLLAAAAPARAGWFGSDAPGRIPVPARPFQLRVEDRSGVVLEIERATFDGEVFLFGTVGLAQVTVPFEALGRVEIRPGPDADHAIAHVLTRSGATQDVVVEIDRPLFGRTTFGNYRIEIGEVRSFDVR